MYFPLLRSCWLVGSLSFLVTSCSNKPKKNEALIKGMQESLDASNRVIASETEIIHNSLKNETSDPKFSAKAAVQYGYVKRIDSITKPTLEYIHGLKKLQSISLNDAHILYKYIIEYKEHILNINPLIKEMFKNSLISISKFDDSAVLNKEHFAEKYFTGNSITSQKSMLSKIENNILFAAYNVTLFCNESIARHYPICDLQVLVPIITQSHSKLLPGDTLEIDAGIGNYKYYPNTEIQINGVKEKVEESSSIRKKLQVPTKPGKYTVPITISFFNETTGKQESVSTFVNYSVLSPCN